MERIESQVTDQVDLAKQILAWIVHAERQMTTRELREALGIEIDEPELDRENCPDVDDMLSACAGLVTVDKGSNNIRLVHYTAQEYFLRTKQTWFPNAQAMITTSCTTCLFWDVSGTQIEHTRQEDDYPYEQHGSVFVLHKYAARYWGKHAVLATSAHSHVMDFLRKLQQVRISASPLQARISQGVHGHFTDSLHLTAHFGLSRATSELLQEVSSPDPQTSTGTTPLMIATNLGHETTVKLLLQGNACVDHLDKYMQTPLTLAIKRGNLAIAQLLLDHHALANGPPGQKDKPLHLAVSRCNAEIATVLIKNDASILQQDEAGEIPLHHAARHGLSAMARLVLPGRDDMNIKDSEGNTALHAAAAAGSYDVVRLLLEKGALVNARGHKGLTALHMAASTPKYIAPSVDSQIVGITLLNYGADTTVEDDQSDTALNLAVKTGSFTFVKLLLDFKVDVNHPQNRPNSSEDVPGKIMDNTGAKPSTTAPETAPTKPLRRFSALHYACWYGRREIARLLLSAGADINRATEDGVTPLHAACWTTELEIIKMLLEAGARVNSKDLFGDTPLDLCRNYSGSESIIQLLSEHGAVGSEPAVPPDSPKEDVDPGEGAEGREGEEEARDNDADAEKQNKGREGTRENKKSEEVPRNTDAATQDGGREEARGDNKPGEVLQEADIEKQDSGREEAGKTKKPKEVSQDNNSAMAGDHADQAISVDDSSKASTTWFPEKDAEIAREMR